MAENETTGFSTLPEITFRDASAQDIEAIATLHADSWRWHYRGAYLDSFLDGDVVADRLAVWGQRLAAPSADQFTIVAERDGAVVGFVHSLGPVPRWGQSTRPAHRLAGCRCAWICPVAWCVAGPGEATWLCW